jgi:hypothetical protein
VLNNNFSKLKNVLKTSFDLISAGYVIEKRSFGLRRLPDGLQRFGGDLLRGGRTDFRHGDGGAGRAVGCIGLQCQFGSLYGGMRPSVGGSHSLILFTNLFICHFWAYKQGKGQLFRP